MAIISLPARLLFVMLPRHAINGALDTILKLHSPQTREMLGDPTSAYLT